MPANSAAASTDSGVTSALPPLDQAVVQVAGVLGAALRIDRVQGDPVERRIRVSGSGFSPGAGNG